MFKVKKFKGKRPLLLWGTITNIEISYQVAKWLYECDYATYLKRGVILLKKGVFKWQVKNRY